jgi:hypothetical protein
VNILHESKLGLNGRGRKGGGTNSKRLIFFGVLRLEPALHNHSGA